MAVLIKYFRPKEATRNVQARIPLKLAKDLEAFKKAKHLSWTQLILGSLQAVSDQTKRKK